MTFDHDSEDAVVAAGNLYGNIMANVKLSAVVLLAVRMTEIDHQSLRKTCTREFLASSLDAVGIVVGLFSAAKDDVAIFISVRQHDGRVPSLRYRQEMVRMFR